MSSSLSLSDNLHYLYDNDIDILNNTIYLISVPDYITGTGVEDTEQSGVEFLQANRFIKNLHTLESLSDDPITIHQSTCGGHWHFGMQIYQAIKSSKNFITIVNHTEARSMSSLTFLAGDERIMMPYSVFMIHTGTIHTGGTLTQLRTEFIQSEKDMDEMMSIYVTHLKDKPYWKNKSKEFINEWLINQMKDKEEFYMSSEDAVKYGFADSIMELYE